MHDVIRLIKHTYTIKRRTQVLRVCHSTDVYFNRTTARDGTFPAQRRVSSPTQCTQHIRTPSFEHETTNQTSCSEGENIPFWAIESDLNDSETSKNTSDAKNPAVSSRSPPPHTLRVSSFSLSRPYHWTWRLIISRIRRILSQIHQNPRITALVSSWQRRQWRRRAVTSARNLDLRASQIKLCFIRLHRHVQCNVLDAKKVVAIGRCQRDGGVGGFVLVYQ
jgi:hypothetical protein